ncbi:MAG: translation initiation factor IF-2, partial [Candidatus Micrarchaeota archaeon]
MAAFKNSSPKWRAGHTSNVLTLPCENDLENLGYFLGAWIGDGSTNLILHNNDREVQHAYGKALSTVFGVSSKVKWGHTCWGVHAKAGKTLSKLLSDVFDLPMSEKSGSVVLPWICQASSECFKGFVEGWFDTDGYVSRLNNSIEITTKSKELARQVAARLIACGVQSIVFEKNGYHVLRIANKPFLEAFYCNFEPALERKTARIKNALEKAPSSRNVDVYALGAEVRRELKKALPAKINKKLPFFNRYAKKPSLSMHVLEQIACNVTKPNEASVCLQQFLARQLNGFAVLSAEKCDNPHEWVYDFTVPETHNFLAERVIIHNTTLLDCIRKSRVQSREAGAITQHIGASEVPIDVVKKLCSESLKKMKIELTIPGLLFVDTPGHEAFANLRKRGGSIADIAVLVVDVKQGIQPQTIEAIEILREYKTPFVVGLTKIDSIKGWHPQKNMCFSDFIKAQRSDVAEELDEKIYKLIGELYKYGFEAERFDRVDDFTKMLAIVPVSGVTGEGLQELLVFISGLAQKYLEKRLELHESQPGKGSILEIREDPGLGKTLDVILYDGVLKQGDSIVFATNKGALSSKVKALMKPKPLDEMRDPRQKFSTVDKAWAASGVKIACDGADDAIAGSSVLVAVGDGAAQKKEIEKELKEIEFVKNELGVVLKADALGSLEALTKLMQAEGITIRAAGIGGVSKKDVSEANAVKDKDEFLGVVFAFNVPVDEGAKAQAEEDKVVVF